MIPNPAHGLRVRMSADLKAKLMKGCAPNKHKGPFYDGLCFTCSSGHVNEFGDAVGILQGPTDYNNVKPDHPDYDPDKIGPEWDVRWQPNNLRYAYHPDDLDPA